MSDTSRKTIAELFDYVLSNYTTIKTQRFAEHPFQDFYRNEFTRELIERFALDDRYVSGSSAGRMGSWTYCPWLAVFDSFITTGAQRGYYLTILFRADMSGFYLTLNQGVTDLVKVHGSKKARIILRARADFYASKLGKPPTGFKTGEIELGARSGTNPTFYDDGSIWAKFYAKNSLPSDRQFLDDVQTVLRAYSALVDDDNSETEPLSESDREVAEEELYEEARRWRTHRRAERNTALAKKAKKIHGATCAACNFDFEKVYGKAGEGYIEAHHIIPLAMINGPVSLNPRKDFICLCANCHRIIHRLSEHPSPFEALKECLQLQRGKK